MPSTFYIKTPPRYMDDATTTAGGAAGGGGGGGGMFRMCVNRSV